MKPVANGQSLVEGPGADTELSDQKGREFYGSGRKRCNIKKNPMSHSWE